MWKQGSLREMVMAVFGGLLGGALVQYAIVGTSATANAAPDGHIVKAQEFQLVSPEGQVTARLAVWNGRHPVLQLGDAHCPARISLGLSEQEGQPYVMMFDEDCRRRATLDLIPSGLPQMTFRDEANIPRARLHLLKSGDPVLQLFDPLGKVLWASPRADH